VLWIKDDHTIKSLELKAIQLFEMEIDNLVVNIEQCKVLNELKLGKLFV
jgi:hypothetical protein